MLKIYYNSLARLPSPGESEGATGAAGLQTRIDGDRQLWERRGKRQDRN